MAAGGDGRGPAGGVRERAVEGAEDAKEKVEQVGWVQRLVAAHKELTASGVSVSKVAASGLWIHLLCLWISTDCACARVCDKPTLSACIGR